MLICVHHVYMCVYVYVHTMYLYNYIDIIFIYTYHTRYEVFNTIITSQYHETNIQPLSTQTLGFPFSQKAMLLNYELRFNVKVGVAFYNRVPSVFLSFELSRSIIIPSLCSQLRFFYPTRKFYKMRNANLRKLS